MSVVDAIAGLPRAQVFKIYRAAADRPLPGPQLTTDELLLRFHPDNRPGARVHLEVGPNRGDLCQVDLAAKLQSNAQIEDIDLAGARTLDTDTLVIGGGGAGAAAAITAAKSNARVLMATKLRLGDSNTVMAEGGIQAAINPEDSPQRHYDDTIKVGHFAAERELVAQMVMDGPDTIRWLLQLGVQFDLAGDDLATKRPGGATADRILSFRDYTGLEMMRVLREVVRFTSGVTVWERAPVVELLSNELGECAGAVVFRIDRGDFVLVRAQAVVLATGGAGRLHLNGFPTSNHVGATGDGLVLAYRLGARLRELDSFQYHPTGLAHPAHLAGSLLSEAVRSSGAQLVNGYGERFIDELQPRDIVSAAIIRECTEGRGVVPEPGYVGVMLDTPGLELRAPDLLRERFGGLLQFAGKCGVDPTVTPLLIYPTLHYQNGGVAIDRDGRTCVPRLFCAGEASGGIHGRNRLMGNALLEIFSFGRRVGQAAATSVERRPYRKIGIEHLQNWQRALTEAGLPLDRRGPPIFPPYANFDLRTKGGFR